LIYTAKQSNTKGSGEIPAFITITQRLLWSVEILTLPLIVQSGVALKVKMNSADEVHIGISYLNINQEVVI